ncbi:MAG: hypothetical protein HY080_07315 [Gammaproteobacteria bacterium]|nr:hypothetical protein [Gammaproteobacteria bacterium]
MNGSHVNSSIWIGSLIVIVLAVGYPHPALPAQSGVPTVAYIPIPIDDDLNIVIPVLVNVPPDPGAAGSATLAGVDSNNNGVRDDLERRIVQLYPNNPLAQAYMNEAAKAYQSVLLNSASVATVVADYTRLTQMQFCLERTVGADARSADLVPYLSNTYERSLAYLAALTAIETVNVPTQFVCP